MASYQELQSKNVRSSLFWVGVVTAITLAAGYFAGIIFAGPNNPYAPVIALSIAGVIAGIQGIVAWFAGADIVLSISGAVEIGPDDAHFRQVYNVVDEMRIASGIPMPRVYIIDDAAPNAFATGRGPKDGRVAITTGLIERLTRDELQGVVAHEMSHIRNGDVLLQTVVGIMVGMIAIISDITLRGLFWGGGRRSSDRDGGGNAGAILMVVGIVFVILAPIFAHLVRMAISRQREYLADATGAQFTRNPEALASALQTISGAGVKMARANRGTAHLWISDPMESAFSTHPPIELRVQRLMEIGRSNARG
jgi:heat shock protein HtpX